MAFLPKWQQNPNNKVPINFHFPLLWWHLFDGLNTVIYVAMIVGDKYVQYFIRSMFQPSMPHIKSTKSVPSALSRNANKIFQWNQRRRTKWCITIGSHSKFTAVFWWILIIITAQKSNVNDERIVVWLKETFFRLLPKLLIHSFNSLFISVKC